MFCSWILFVPYPSHSYMKILWAILAEIHMETAENPEAPCDFNIFLIGCIIECHVFHLFFI